MRGRWQNLRGVVVVCLLACGAQAFAAETGEWTEEMSGGGLTLYSRARSESKLREFKATGVIEAPPAVVFAVIDDSEEYPHFMPYTSEVRVLKREKNRMVAYQRLAFPIVSDRDYTLVSRNEKWLGPEGPIYRVRWEPANELGPPLREGVQRVALCEGGWLLEPGANGTTRATYSIFTDSGGGLPPFLAEKASRIGIRKIFEAIRKQVKQPKYSSAAK